MTQDDSRGKAYIEDDGKLGLRCIRLWKGARSRMTKESRGKAYVEDNRKLGLSV